MATAHPAKPVSPTPGVYPTLPILPWDNNDLAVLNLNDLGVILDCSQACMHVFGYRPGELAGSHVSHLLPQLPEAGLVLDGRINPRLAYLCHCGIAFQACHRDGRCFASELFINRLDAHNVVVLVRRLDVTARLAEVRATH